MEVAKRRDVEGDETYSLCQNFILDHGGVVPHIHILDAYGGNFCDHYSPKSIGYGRIHADEVKVDGTV